MSKEEITRKKRIDFIKSNNPYYAFADFSLHSAEQLEKIKKDIELEIKAIAEGRKNKQQGNRQ